ncbi:hypothetical protein ABB37_02744 [Leptomonas pyrrhocoris]|uniref:Uncharacterized protein n=1 Tax=Leptomonas pyrrhocoris TaxID=157538 RepID=A0A0N0VGD0_LEPPY|nr:hypothetical protein ABB37_02744 [Leptomonas pyrrhocoris]KPA83014.1 hypothetical protein ABB37_02744 [Leptomonas pyrrhocoris]|eukprot:XP_015661453.1 hypothetical protein ABB37_02744 [Leptomonas pyrrhocoris]
MSLEFFTIFVSISGGAGVIAFVIVVALCCREYKLLETDDDDSESDSVYSDSGASPASNSGEGPDYPNDAVSQTERSWDAESNNSFPEENESHDSFRQHRHRHHRHRHRHHHRHGRHRSRSRSCGVSTPNSAEEEDAAVTDEFWNGSY